MAQTRRARDQEEADFRSVWELIDNLPDAEKADFHRQYDLRYGYRDEDGEPGEEGEDRGRRARDTWPKRPGRDGELGVRGAERPGGAADEAYLAAGLRRIARETMPRVRALVGDSALPRRRETFEDRYPDAARIKTSVWG